jgi:CCR4-NOT complex subunit CAF16
MSYRAAAADDDIEEESLEHTLLVVREVSVFKIPPRSSSGGYKCGEWLQSDKIWSGRLRVVSIRDLCEIRLEDSNTGALFAACHVHPGKRDLCVEPAMDSSRYFVLRIDDGQGKHAFIGLGFAERNEAFDFNVALSDHEKHVLHGRNREDDDEVRSKASQSSGPSLDLRLKVGSGSWSNIQPFVQNGILVM